MNHGFGRCVVKLFVLSLGLLLVGCSSSRPIQTRPDRVLLSSAATSQSAELPAAFIEHRVILDVMLNGMGPYRMILDTGSAISQVPPEVARAIGVVGRGHVETIDAHGKASREPMTRVDRVAVGSLVGRGVPFTIDALPEHIAEAWDAVGVIGNNLFVGHTLILDYPNERVWVSDVRLDSDVPGTIPMWLEHRRVPFIDAGFKIPGIGVAFPCKMLIDTGSGALLSLSGGHARMYADMKNRVQVGAAMSATGSIRPVEYARLNFDLDFNGVVARQLMAIVDQRSGKNASIGGDFLRRFKVSLDPVGGHARFELTDGTREVEMPVWRVHGFTISLEDERRFVVKEVLKGSQAEIGGLRAGDVLRRFDGEPITTDPLNWPGPTLVHGDAERVFLIERDGTELELTLAFQDLIPAPKKYTRFLDSSNEDAEE